MCMICASSRAKCDLLRWMGRLSPLKSVSCPFPSGRRVTVSVQLLPLDEVVARMHAGEFKPNCAVGTSRLRFEQKCLALTASQVLIDFMVRHGHLTPENEPRYIEITQRLHGQFDLERW